ncbi:MAG: DUF58 domain-containing protein [Bacteroides sp.]|nr:DUF58 domain-containing protein [Bacteroides sp.]MCM1549463.1 DUF58 domain-containing protein [Clostridium sp.]
MGEKLFDQAFFTKLNQLAIAVNTHMTHGMGGGRKSNAKGTSVEFSDYREYMPGDDIRRVDWGAYGRLDKLYIKRFMEEKEGIFQIFIDTSNSMSFGEPPKSRTALQLAGALAYLVLNNLDRVYVSEMQESTLTQGKGRAGKQAFRQIMQELEAVEFDGRTNLNKAIMSRQYQGSGISIVISDFLDEKGIEEAVKYLRYKKQQVILIQVLARQEVEIEGDGVVNLLDMETGEEVRLSLNRTTIEQYNQALENMTERMNALARRYEMTFIRMLADEPLEKFLFDHVCNQGIIVRK